MADYNSSLPIRTENAGDAIVKVADATTPSQQLAVNADGSINVTDNGGSITVDGTVTVTATDLDIRDLDAAQDNVAISDGTDTLAVNADGSINSVVTATNLDIRDLTHVSDSVKVGDGTDFLAVNADGSINITDNGSSITVDATDLDIRDLDSAQDSVEVLQASHDNLNANANLQVGNADVANGNPVPVSDAGGSLTVDATDLDIRDLDATQDNVAISDGTDSLAINTDGSINVVVQEDVGTEIVNYDTQASLASGATDNHDWTSAAASKLYQVFASASGKLRIEVQIETGAATNVFNTIAVGFNSTATPNIDLTLAKYAAVPNGARVRVIRRNNDNQAMDVYSTIVAIQG